MQALIEVASRLPPFTTPKFASGGTFAAGQQMWVGERGPELVSFSGNGQATRTG